MGDDGSRRLTAAMTFVFTDVVGSTRLWAADPEATARSFLVHDTIVRTAVKQRNGELFGWAGDSFRAAFDDRNDALEACAAVHAGLAAADWQGDPVLRVRIGVTHGQALRRDGDYFGPTLNTAARLEELAQPGQTIMTAAVAAGLHGAEIRSLGAHRVRDIADELELFQLGTSSYAPLRTIDARLSTVPPAVGSLIGRAAALGEVRSALVDRQPVTVVGTGGAGKTRLAIEVAHLELSEQPDGCYFVDFGGVTDALGVVPAIARGARITISQVDPLIEIAEWCAQRRALLVLDNCEHLIGPVRDVVEYLTSHAPDLRVLITSREPIRLAGERVVRIGPLPSVRDGGPAVQLFVGRVRDEVPDFEPTAAELGQIVDICDHLDGIPLALELAAARSGVLGLDQLLAGMHDRFRLLSSASADGGTRTLREAIDWSFELLSPVEQQFFARCGAFAGSFDLRAASALVPSFDPLDVADLLQSLARKSLLTTDGGLGARFRLLETLRAYALLRLDQSGQTDDVRRMHFDHYCGLVGADRLDVALDLDRAARLAPDWTNIASALEWGCRTGAWAPTARLAIGCAGLWNTTVSVLDGKRWIDEILPHVDDRQTQGLLEYVLASLEAQVDGFERVHELMASMAASPQPEIAAQALALSGYLHSRHDRAKSQSMLGLADELIELHQLGSEAQITALWSRGAVSFYEPDLDRAVACFRSALAVARTSARRTPNTVYAGLGLAAAQVVMGRPSDALATLDTHDASLSRWDSSPILRGIALLDLDRSAEATDLIFTFARESLLGRLARMSNDAMLGFAALALHRSEPDHAWTLLQQAVTPRTPFTIGLAEGLAARISVDHETELRRRHRDRAVDLAELDAIDHLRDELDRLGREAADSAPERRLA